MANWGAFTWGDGTLWGSTETPPPPSTDATETEVLAHVGIDWEDSGTFTNEMDRLIKIKGFRGRKHMLQQGTGGFSPVETGKYTLTLENYDGRYDAWNVSSPLYPNVECGHAIKIRFVVESTLYNLFYGFITDIVSSMDAKGNKTAVITAEDGMRKLNDIKLRPGLEPVFGARVDELITTFLTNIKWNYGSDLEVSSDTVLLWRNRGDNTARSEIDDLTNFFLGWWCIDNQGRVKYRDRLNADSPIMAYTQDEILKSVEVPQPWINRRNIIRYKVRGMGLYHTYDLTRGQILVADPEVNGRVGLVAPNQVVEMFVPYKTLNPLYELPTNHVLVEAGLTPLYVTDFFSDGPGNYLVFLTQDSALGGPYYSVTASVYDNLSNSMKIVFTNTTGLSVYVSRVHIQASRFAWEDKEVEVTYPSNPETITDPREFNIKSDWSDVASVEVFEDSFNHVVITLNTPTTALVNFLGAWLDRRNAAPIITIQHRFTEQFTPDLFDVVSLELAEYGLPETNYRVGGIEHQSLSMPFDIQTTLYLEPVP